MLPLLCYRKSNIWMGVREYLLGLLLKVHFPVLPYIPGHSDIPVCRDRAPRTAKVPCLQKGSRADDQKAL